jgi:hypothetical protein
MSNYKTEEIILIENKVLDADLSVKEFAEFISYIMQRYYGKHLYNGFIETIKTNLK